jgi:hypothetical protein
MIKKGKHQKEAIEKEVSDDDKQRRGIQLFFVNYFTKVRAWKMFLIFLASALAIVGASICIAISTN